MEYKGRSLISASFIFVGLLLPLRFPQYFWLIMAAVVLASALLTFWVFAEKPNLERIKEDWFTLLFVTVFTLASGVFGYLVVNPVVQALILGSTIVFLYFIFIVASRLKRNYTPSLFLRNIISMAAMLGAFFSIADLLRWISIYDSRFLSVSAIVLAFVSVFVISEFLFEVHGFEESVLYSLTLALTLSQIVWISSFWLISYPYSEKATSTGVPLPAIVGTVFFYLFWGISHHRLDNSLTKKILWEYIVISVTFILILFFTARWLPAVR